MSPGGKYVAKDFMKLEVCHCYKSLLNGGYINGDCMTLQAKLLQES